MKPENSPCVCRSGAFADIRGRIAKTRSLRKVAAEGEVERVYRHPGGTWPPPATAARLCGARWRDRRSGRAYSCPAILLVVRPQRKAHGGRNRGVSFSHGRYFRYPGQTVHEPAEIGDPRPPGSDRPRVVGTDTPLLTEVTKRLAADLLKYRKL